MSDTSYRSRSFTINDPDARLRDPDDLTKFASVPAGQPTTIPNGTTIAVDQVKSLATGAKQIALFVEVKSADRSKTFGWTSVGNIAGKFLSETLGSIAPTAGASRYGAHAAWSNGSFLGQITLVKVMGTNREVEFIAGSSRDSFLALTTAAAGAGVTIGLNSGFRSWPEQKALRDGWDRRLPGFNPANKPGFSNHQNGIAFDIEVGGGGSHPTYVWLCQHATKHGFLRTVPKEAWHWEYRPQAAATARARGSFRSWD